MNPTQMIEEKINSKIKEVAIALKICSSNPNTKFLAYKDYFNNLYNDFVISKNNDSLRDNRSFERKDLVNICKQFALVLRGLELSIDVLIKKGILQEQIGKINDIFSIIDSFVNEFNDFFIKNFSENEFKEFCINSFIDDIFKIKKSIQEKV